MGCCGLPRASLPPLHMCRWDLRDASGGGAKPMISFTGGHAGDVMSLSFSPFQEYLLLTASVDK